MGSDQITVLSTATSIASSTTTAASTTTIASSTSAEATTTRPPTAPDRAYSLHCSSCHGAHGQGISGPKLGGGEMVEKYPDVADLIVVVGDGMGAGMPGFKNILSQHEIEGLVGYIRESLDGEP